MHSNRRGVFVGVELNTTVLSILLWILIAGGSTMILVALAVILLRQK